MDKKQITTAEIISRAATRGAAHCPLPLSMCEECVFKSGSVNNKSELVFEAFEAMLESSPIKCIADPQEVCSGYKLTRWCD